ncbi:MAG: nuclease-related domain-containing protein [Mycobacteriales bacterium]
MTNDVLPGSERAGGSADAKFKRMAGEWRRARLRGLRWVFLGGGTVCLFIGADQRHPVTFYFSAAGGALIATWMMFRDFALPSYIEKWRIGAEGEKATGKVLARLGAEWTVRHDLQGRYGNVDHLVIGPPGVFLIDSKAWHQGITTITSDGPVVASDHDPDAVWEWRGLPDRMRGAAGGASTAIKALSDRRISVTPVVAIWGEFPDRVQERRGVTYIDADHLADWLTSKPARLSEQDRAVLTRLY